MIRPYNIKIARTIAGLTQQELADKIGVDVSTVRSWEKKKNSISLDNALKLCNACGVDIDAIFLPRS